MTLFLLLALGCTISADSVHTARPAVQMVVLDDSLQPAAALWEKELGRRFDHATAILCHGGDLIQGEWVVKVANGDHAIMRADDLVRRYRKLYPDRTLVLVACNPGHLKLHVPGVYYAESSVWVVPDRDVPDHQQQRFLTIDGDEHAPDAGASRSDADPDVVGNAFEFVSE